MFNAEQRGRIPDIGVVEELRLQKSYQNVTMIQHGEM